MTGATALGAVLSEHRGPTATVAVTFGDEGTAEQDGIESKVAVVRQLSDALRILRSHDPDRVFTIGGDCSVSVAPFVHLAARYGDDLAVIWIDSHPDVSTPASAYCGYNAMAVSAITGHGDPAIVSQLPATVPGNRIALAGLHSWTGEDYPNAAEWSISAFSPDALRTSTGPLLTWLRATGCSRVAIHFDVDAVDVDDVMLGLGKERGGLRLAEVGRIVEDISDAAEVVAVTVAEFIPRQLIRLQALIESFPLVR